MSEGEDRTELNRDIIKTYLNGGNGVDKEEEARRFQEKYGGHNLAPKKDGKKDKEMSEAEKRKAIKAANKMNDEDYAIFRSKISDRTNISLKFMDKMRSDAIRDEAVEERARILRETEQIIQEREVVRTDEFFLAQMITDKHEDLKYVGDWSKWMVWDGKVWEKDTQDIVPDAITDDLLEFVEDPKGLERKEVARIKKQSTVKAVDILCRGKKKHRSKPEDWDSSDWILNTPDSMINLKTGKPHKHNPNKMITLCTKVAPGGECPIWLSFLSQITNDNQDLVGYLRRLMGYCLTGSVEQQMFAFMHGDGANGKGTFLGTIQAIMGPYAGSTRNDILLETFGRDHPAGEAALMGKRLVVTNELSGGKRWDEGRVKSLTGGDRIQARFMRGDFFEFEPHFKLVIAGNHKPAITSVDVAMARRMSLIPFDVVIPEDRRDKKLPHKLMGERGGILSWMIQGCKDYVEGGLQPPAVVTDATKEYFRDEDVFSRFVGECCNIGSNKNPAFDTQSSVLYKGWKFWCESNGERVGSHKAFANLLKSKGYEKKVNMKFTSYTGITLDGEFINSMSPISQFSYDD